MIADITLETAVATATAAATATEQQQPQEQQHSAVASTAAATETHQNVQAASLATPWRRRKPGFQDRKLSHRL